MKNSFTCLVKSKPGQTEGKLYSDTSTYGECFLNKATESNPVKMDTSRTNSAASPYT